MVTIKMPGVRLNTGWAQVYGVRHCGEVDLNNLGVGNLEIRLDCINWIFREAFEYGQGEDCTNLALPRY